MTSKHLRAPDDLSDASRRLFRRLAADLQALGGTAEVDALLLADALRLRERLAAVRVQLAADGPTVLGSQGQPRPHPLLAVELNLARDIRSAFGQLRLSPDKRPDVTEVDTAGRLVDPYDEDDDEVGIL